MIDLHLHLDGSLSEDDFKYLAKLNNIDLGDDFPNNIYVPMECKSLDEYLERFDLPVKLLQTAESIEYATYSLVKRLCALGLFYAEIRFAPLLHLTKGMTQFEVVKSALCGLKKAIKECDYKIDANLILCCMRHASIEENLTTVETAHLLSNDKVVAIDLAGGETIHPCSYFSECFSLARRYKLNITIHAGEATGSDEIMRAIGEGAVRIGHGVHLSLDMFSVKKVNNAKITFEFCPTSNLQTKSLKTYKDVPLRQFINKDIRVTINCDNMTVSNTDCIKEMAIMVKTFKLDKREVIDIYDNAINASFTSEENKNKMRSIMLSAFDGSMLERLNLK
ncbi:MAG: adenosine deaminase [Bacilli bacterium]|nr:adenosine deaminase [Bacilli bacterium]